MCATSPLSLECTQNGQKLSDLSFSVCVCVCSSKIRVILALRSLWSHLTLCKRKSAFISSMYHSVRDKTRTRICLLHSQPNNQLDFVCVACQRTTFRRQSIKPDDKIASQSATNTVQSHTQRQTGQVL